MKKSISVLFAALAITASSCKKDYLDLNTNPNNPSVATPALLLSGALRTSAGIVNGGLSNLNVTGNATGYYTQYACWMGYLSWSTGYQANVALEQYQFTTANYDVWTPLYLNISNYNALYNSTTNPYYQAMAKIMEVYDYQALVDNYNNVPYSQAGQGVANLNPAYDSGSAIYDDLVKQIDAAIALIQKAPAGTVGPTSDDIMYQGHMTNWMKFANTLKLRLAIRQVNVASKTAALKAAVAATSAIGYLDGTNGATVNPGYLNSDANGGQESPLWLNYGYTQNGGAQTNNQEYQANSYAVSFFQSNNDPRLTQVYAPVDAKGDIGSTPFGGTTPPTPAASKLGPGVLKSATMNANVLSAAEALFLESEAAVRGYISGDASALYKAGITASFVDDALTAAQAQTFYAQSSVAFPAAGSTEQQIQAIIDQKWAALDPYGALEAYNDYRRTGYPNNIPLSIYPGANAPNQVTRIYYPAVEYQTNAANVAAQGTINIFTSKIFWAK